MNIKYRTELPDFMRELNRPMTAAELGVAEGYNSADLLANGLEKLYLVDTWATIPGQQGDGGHPQEWHDKNYEAAIERVKPYGEKAIFLRGMSTEMAKYVPDNSLGLLYLDGDHSYMGVVSDLVTWFPKVVNGGIIAGHDFLAVEYGVQMAVLDFCRFRFNVHTIHEDKNEDAGFWFIKNVIL